MNIIVISGANSMICYHQNQLVQQSLPFWWWQNPWVCFAYKHIWSISTISSKACKCNIIRVYYLQGMKIYNLRAFWDLSMKTKSLPFLYTLCIFFKIYLCIFGSLVHQTFSNFVRSYLMFSLTFFSSFLELCSLSKLVQ